jgi:AraC family transcriptional regulator
MSALITPTELPKWVPGRVLAASDGLGWHNVALRSYHYTGLDVEVPGLNDFMVVAYRDGATRMQRRFEGGWTKTTCAPGDVSLLTRSQRSHWYWTDDIDVSHVYLSDKLVSGVANEMLDRSVAEVRLRDVLKTVDPVVTACVEGITREAQQRSPGSSLYVEALGTQLAVHLLRHYAAISFREPGERGCLSPCQCRRVAEFIDEHLQESLSLQTLAAQVQLGVWNFVRRFRESFGRAPHAYVVDRRVERARQLLEDGLLSVKEVAFACGFADQAHMTRMFQARLHTTPAALRRARAPSTSS